MNFGDFATLAFSGIAAVAGSLGLLFLRQILTRMDRVEATLHGTPETGNLGLVVRMATFEDRMNNWRPYRKNDLVQR